MILLYTYILVSTLFCGYYLGTGKDDRLTLIKIFLFGPIVLLYFKVKEWIVWSRNTLLIDKLFLLTFTKYYKHLSNKERGKFVQLAIECNQSKGWLNRYKYLVYTLIAKSI